MPKGHFEKWTDEHLRTFGDELLAAAEGAAKVVGGWRKHTVKLGRTVVEFRSTDDRVHSILARTMAHLTTNDPPTATISVCDTASTGVPRPTQPSWMGETWRHEGSATVLYQDRVRDSVAWSDSERGVALWWIPDEASIPAWERPTPLRALIDRLLSPLGVSLVHAGIVGDDRGGVMLTGRGGSGKSTSVVACVAAKLQSGGDDFVLMHNDERDPAICWSMFATARLLPESPAWSTFSANPAAIEMPRSIDDDRNSIKRTVFLNEQFPGSMRDRFPIRAVAVPMVTDCTITKAVPMRPAAALLALAPSSMLQLVDPHRSTLAALAALVREVPCYALHVGSDLADVSRAVGELLNSTS